LAILIELLVPIIFVGLMEIELVHSLLGVEVSMIGRHDIVHEVIALHLLFEASVVIGAARVQDQG